jgi:hypothetical protein
MGWDGMGWDGMGWDGMGGVEGEREGATIILTPARLRQFPRITSGRSAVDSSTHHATCNVDNAAYNAQHATRSMHHATRCRLSTARWQPRGLACESSARTCVWRRAALGLCCLVCASVDGPCGRVARASLTRLGCDGLHGGLCVVLSRMQRAPLANACNWERPPRSRAGKRERLAVLWCWACCMMRPSAHALAPPAAVAELLRRPEIVALKRRMASRGGGTRHIRGMHAVYTLQARGTHATCATKRHR